ncbi:MAG: DegV family protein [Lachnospiraceae bacterium]|nr:DegV family protein [Lachnospiraceae bacterium]HCJ06932.1 DegV family protein [Lachnospiraceae bacterium]
MKTAIMTDSNTGLSNAQAQELGVYLLPMPVIIDGNVYFEGENLTAEEFFTSLEEGKDVTTSQPSPGDVMDMWDQILADGYDEVVYIPMSSGLSSSCASAKGLALDYEDKVFVVDNHRISVTMVLAVKTAIQLKEEGKTGREIQEILEKQAFDSSIYLAVNTLEYLKKSGRVTAAGAAVAAVLNIKPVLTIQGEKLDAFAKAKGMKKAKKMMLAAIAKDIENRFPDFENKKIIGAAGAGLTEEEKEKWMAEIADAFPGAEVFYSPLSLSVCAHTGPGAYGIGISV